MHGSIFDAAGAIACFDQALTDAGLAADDRLRQALHENLDWATPAQDR